MVTEPWGGWSRNGGDGHGAGGWSRSLRVVTGHVGGHGAWVQNLKEVLESVGSHGVRGLSRKCEVITT